MTTAFDIMCEFPATFPAGLTADRRFRAWRPAKRGDTLIKVYVSAGDWDKVVSEAAATAGEPPTAASLAAAVATHIAAQIIASEQEAPIEWVRDG